ncbi:E3 ubiquitin-protein ligase RNF217 isoform X1 [Ahaetulla prasina]|uniref:E3 ubiquitin-protein ligase RNF217 isoform X1 n=1 Tax=Ahaetulla prasina TaxID=499056 RepID=UPI00264992C5|nr:E3 ubiquitin-protein ligase RNF217 isoform X1 [Ahaetulla prasina]
MGERLSTASSPPEPDGAAAPEPRLPTTGTQPPLPTVSGRTPRPQQEDDAGPPPAEPQGQEAGNGGGAPLEEGPRSEAPSSNSCRLPLRPVSRAESEQSHDGPPPPPSPPPPPTPGEEGRQEDPQPAVSPPPSQPSVVGAGGKGIPSGHVEVDLYLLPESFSGLISGDFGTLLVLSCRVCLEEKPLKPLPCCKKPVCEACLKRYLSSQVQVGQADIPCPITECSEHLDETTILFNLPHDDIIKYKYFLELGRIGSSTKPCPQCKHFTTFKRKGHIPTPTKMENKYKIQCPTCQFVWCFKCHSPWHEGVNCKEFKKGDKLLRHWASEIEHGQRNAQKCPKCKIHIQRTEGCDHMTCSQCNTNFCYRCGERYRQLRFFGDHTSNLSVFGCKYRYLPESPHLRRLVRGSVCGGKLLIAPVILVLGLVVGAVVVLIGLFVFPIYCLCKKKKKRPQTEMPWYE